MGLRTFPGKFLVCVNFGGNPCRDVETLRFYTRRHTDTHIHEWNYIWYTSFDTRASHGLSTLRISDFRSSFGARARVAPALLQPCSLAFLKPLFRTVAQLCQYLCVSVSSLSLPFVLLRSLSGSSMEGVCKHVEVVWLLHLCGVQIFYVPESCICQALLNLEFVYCKAPG